MDKLEKIKAEIKRRYDEFKFGSSAEAKYRCEAYEELLDYADSVQDVPINEDIEQAAVQDFKYLVDFDKNNFFEIYKAGANWKEQQIMSKAVDGYVIEDIQEGNGDFLLSADYLPASMGLKEKQKVKVIVIKDN
jgi:hypothetical protein